jgi:hypothetical protein
VKLQDESPKAPAIQAFSGALEDALRREFVYAGDLLVFKGVGPMAELCVLTDELIREALGASDPAGTQFGMKREDYVARVGELQKLYTASPGVRRAAVLLAAPLGSVERRRRCSGTGTKRYADGRNKPGMGGECTITQSSWIPQAATTRSSDRSIGPSP